MRGLDVRGKIAPATHDALVKSGQQGHRPGAIFGKCPDGDAPGDARRCDDAVRQTQFAIGSAPTVAVAQGH